ncbi:hypothetical protein RHMOL_Rhmol01G0103200 [Rhododendron molle]|uniref:Uncharacterized protein n=1 Tax=Rhododendron molle TaxID=49168 RepID=A0ACC0Q1S8_RHOML|nr:hypothetical protein RHMOL_Rhmol01G0103200 [Rhododendron molle]
MVVTAVSRDGASVHESRWLISSCRFWEPTHRASRRLTTGDFDHSTRSDLVLLSILCLFISPFHFFDPLPALVGFFVHGRKTRRGCLVGSLFGFPINYNGVGFYGLLFAIGVALTVVVVGRPRYSPNSKGSICDNFGMSGF